MSKNGKQKGSNQHWLQLGARPDALVEVAHDLWVLHAEEVLDGRVPGEVLSALRLRRLGSARSGRPRCETVMGVSLTRSSSREVRIRVPFSSVLYFSRGTLPPKKGKSGLLENLKT